MQATPADYLLQLQALLPPGDAWPREPDAVLTRLLLGLAHELARVDGRAGNLLDEVDPRTALEMLAEWERVCGLPDSCAPLGETIQRRRAAVVARLTARGGQSPAYYVALAAALGYAVEIEEFRPFRCGESGAGDALYDDDAVHAWRVVAPATTVTYFGAGVSGAGEPLAGWGNAALECAIRRHAPAHTTVLFGYIPDRLACEDGFLLAREDGLVLTMEVS